jgi:hypothetical protein
MPQGLYSSTDGTSMMCGSSLAIDFGPLFDFTRFGQRELADNMQLEEGEVLALDEAAHEMGKGFILTNPY